MLVSWLWDRNSSLDYPGRPNVIPNVLKDRRGKQRRIRGRYDYKSQRDSILLALKTEKRVTNLGSGWSLETEKGKEMDSLLLPSENNSATLSVVR